MTGTRYEILAVRALLSEAICIQQDLVLRLSLKPEDNSLRAEHAGYEKLISQLADEYSALLEDYLGELRAQFL